MNRTSTILGGALCAGLISLCSPAAIAGDVVYTERVEHAPVVRTEVVRPAPVFEERTITTTTETRPLTDREKDVLRERQKFERKQAEAEREYLEKMREARKDFREEVRDDLDD